MNIIDYKNPEYNSFFKARVNRLKLIREDESFLPWLRSYYKTNPAQFISDWGCTFDPRNTAKKLPSIVPFILFERQVEWINWAFDLWKTGEFGLTEKSREMGVSWLSVAFAVTMCVFNDGFSVGFGSRKEEYVDKLGDLKAILPRARQFISMLPIEFRGGCDINKHAPHKRIFFPATNSFIAGEAGDNMGRGDRTSIYIRDEAAFIERPELVDRALADTTPCLIDVSTPNGTNNPFYRKKIGGQVSVFTFHWRDDPRKDDAWYQKRVARDDPLLVAQEIDLNYSASVEGIVIPAAWVHSAINAHLKLRIDATGVKLSTLDVADEGKDKNALCHRHGILVDSVESWSGKGSDIYESVKSAMHKSIIHGSTILIYDADGLGAGVRGDAKRISLETKNKLIIDPFRGSGKVFNPRGQMMERRFNEDMFSNAKAQAWWALRQRFLETHRAIAEGIAYDANKIISISNGFVEFNRLVTELSQPTFSTNDAGKILIDKTPSGGRSPNLADAVMMAFAPTSGRNINAIL